MNRHLLSLGLLVIFTINWSYIFPQKSEIRKIWKMTEDPGSLHDALIRTNILISADEKRIADALFLKATILKKIYYQDVPMYRNIKHYLLEESVEYYLACLAVKDKNKYRADVNEFFSYLHGEGYQKAGRAFDKANYDTSLTYFLAIAATFDLLDVFDPEVYFYAGASAYFLGYHQEAMKQVTTFLELKPDDFKGNYGIGILYYDKAQNLDKIISAISDSAILAENKSKRKNNIEKAYYYLKKAREINPDHEDIDEALKAVETIKERIKSTD